MSILQNALHSPGVYGISNAREWILVGSGDDVQNALLAHLTQPGTRLLSRIPTGFMFEPCEVGECANRRQALIAELRPVCNS